MKGRDLPRYVHRRKRDGVLLFRKKYGGQITEVRMETQFPEGAVVPFELHQEVQRLLALPAPSGNDVSSVIARYRVSPEYRSLALSTQGQYDRRLDYLEEYIGGLEPKKIKVSHVKAWLNKWAEVKTPREANYLLAVLKIVMKMAVEVDLLDPGKNPAQPIGQYSYEKKKRVPWPQWAIDAFREAASGRDRLLFELLLGTGQRFSDVLNMKWSDYDGDFIKVVQSKTKTKLEIPPTQALREALQAAPRSSIYIVPSKHDGGRLGYKGALESMIKVRRQIGAMDYDQHSLRYTAAAELARAGLSDEFIGAITGHKDAKMIAHYSDAERQKVRAIHAQKQRDGS